MSRSPAAWPKRCAAPRRRTPALQVQVEVDRIDQIEPALAAGRGPAAARQHGAGDAARGGGDGRGPGPLEASGGVNLDTIRGIAETGVDFISVGRITQSAPAVDIGLDYALQ